MFLVSVFLLFALTSSFPLVNFEKSITIQVNISCAVRRDWCANITLYTANYTNAVPTSFYTRDISFMEGTFCVCSSTATPVFADVVVPFRTELGTFVSYQMQHSCSTDRKPDCVDVPHATYVPREELFIKLFEHVIGTEQGSGECRDFSKNQPPIS